MSIRDQKGQTMTEYVLIIALVVGVIFGAFKLFGPQITTALSSIGLKITTTTTESLAK